MNFLPELFKNHSWKGYVSPVLAVLFGYLTLQTLFSVEPLHELVYAANKTQGQAPEVAYHALPRLFFLVVSGLLFNVFFFLGLRQWARYYLNRKLFLSYLVFAIIPIITTTMIFSEMVRTGFGLYSVKSVEKTFDQFANELEEYVTRIQNELKFTSESQMDEEEIAQFINEVRKKELPRFSGSGECFVDVYYLTPKFPSAPRQMLPILAESNPSIPAGFLSEDTPEFERIYPNWMRHRFTDIISRDGNLYLAHISKVDMEDNGSYLVVASLPTNKGFLNKLREAENARISLVSIAGTISSDRSDGKWYLRLLLRIFSSAWDIQVLDWETGYYDHYGKMRFDIEPSLLSDITNRGGALNIFHSEEKEHVLKIIIGVALFLLLGEFIAIIYGISLVSYITRSLNIIATGHERVGQSQLNYRLPYLGKDQIGSMGRSFNSMVDNIQSLVQQVLEQQKFKEELRIARDIQMSLLTDVAALKWVGNIAATCIPAREVGGDYYEILDVESGEVGMFIADVSGKGTSAAFYMAELKGVLLALNHLWNDPHELMLKMNEILFRALKSNVFISGAYLLVDPVTGRGRLARAGHCPAYHVKSDGTVHELAPPGMAIGIAKNQVFGRIIKVEELEMEADDKIILYTDGLDEMTFHNEMYGIERLKEVLSNNAALDAYQLKDAILEDVLNFLSSGEQNDDLTLVVSGLPERK
ncbi:PP2C family protein-serine/threonine phosphatase [Acanthopleuribacter pedis]|uniref:SpoIIE family protein phosphatase n=1 Tax=Acanthopleuribacter pedis TaxID=442870 RepID=A0A8J7QDE0_9BACT|nr:SpoIIE family protein phosphatase [Acanthopleuribacter pedis]MBO1319016.1 SpoIIE family protein phosphatase [Acanthopleuribacter pedis]